MLMHDPQRKMSENVTQVIAYLALKLFDDRVGLAAVRALVVSIFQQLHGSIETAADVIVRKNAGEGFRLLFHTLLPQVVRPQVV